MNKILRIDASARQVGSISRDLGDAVEATLRKQHPRLEVRHRDIVGEPIGHITSQTVVGYQTPSDQRTPELRAATALSDELIAELREADVLLLTAPMYNFSIPSTLKAWIDQIARIGETFSYDGVAFNGLLTGKRAVIVNVYGTTGYLNGAAASDANFVQPYLKAVLNFLGITDILFFALEETSFEAQQTQKNIKRLKAEIETVLREAYAVAA